MPSVVVLNHNADIKLRHIVTVKEPYNVDEFKAWYYENYRELEGDEFVYCPTKAVETACIKKHEPWREI